MTEWPALPYEQWAATKRTLHRYTQIVGKVRMALVPPRNHWWHVTLYLGTRGLTTGPMPDGDRHVEIAFDLLDHRRRLVNVVDHHRRLVPARSLVELLVDGPVRSRPEVSLVAL